MNHIFVDKVSSILEDEAPLKTYQVRRGHVNWLSDDIKTQMKHRDSLRELARNTGNASHWQDYKKCKNECTKNVKNLKIEHYRNLYLNFEKEHDVKNILKTTKKLLNSKSGGAPKNLLIDGKLLKRPVEVANSQMLYFHNKVRKLSNQLPDTNINPLKWLQKALDNWDSKGKFPSFTFSEISLQDTISLISQLGNSTSFGSDNIDALAIKAVTLDLAIPIKHLINTSLSTSKYANKWKLAKILPLLKSSELNKLLPASYRPIAILPTVSKLVEKAAQAQLLKYMEMNGMMNGSSHAYRKGLSTTTTLIELTDRLFEAIDKNKLASIMTIDQSAAFDCVPHHLLVDKLKLYNLDNEAIKWITSYLGNRTQFVNLGRAQSAMYAVERGVPQGSVLGPLLYSLFTNEMSESIKIEGCNDQSHQVKDKLFRSDCRKCGNITQYADDANYLITNKHRQDNQQRLINSSESLSLYLNSNGLTINLDKTKLVEVMIAQKRGKTKGEPPQLTVLNSSQQAELISDSSSCRVLGMNIQNNLTWKAHLETGTKSLLPSLRKSLGMLNNLGRKLPTGSRATLARGYILSRISYLVSVWGGGTENLIGKVQVIQNAAARWITNSPRRTRISTLLDKTGWLSVKEMNKLSNVTIIWKTINNRTPSNIADKLVWDRATKNIHIQEPRLQFSKMNFVYKASHDWNSLPDIMKNNGNIGNFKRQVKVWIKDQRTRPPDNQN